MGEGIVDVRRDMVAVACETALKATSAPDAEDKLERHLRTRALPPVAVVEPS